MIPPPIIAGLGLIAVIAIARSRGSLFSKKKEKPQKPPQKDEEVEKTTTTTPEGGKKPEGKTDKPQPKSSKKKIDKGSGLLERVLLTAIVLSIILWYNHKELKAFFLSRLAAEVEQTRIEERQWEYYFRLPAGVYVNDRNESSPDEMIAEEVFKDDNHLWVDLHYKEYGRPEVERIRITRVGGNLWEGTSEQDNPPARARLSLIESVVGQHYAGSITWTSAGKYTWSKNGPTATCYLRKGVSKPK